VQDAFEFAARQVVAFAHGPVGQAVAFQPSQPPFSTHVLSVPPLHASKSIPARSWPAPPLRHLVKLKLAD
jgi:hypothetical protein